METIVDVLKTVEQQGTFCAIQEATLDQLSLSVEGFGKLSLPLSVSDAKKLIDLSQPAQFGWRDQTILDKKIRNAWEIKKARIKINNRQWNRALNPLLASFKLLLGLSNSEANLTAELHNLLIYEKGQFFHPHQDSEKCDGMIATLVVVLPSEHEGGNLIVDHRGEKTIIRSSRFPLDKMTLVAFYADCYHEVKKITSGYRIALTYNLMLKQPEKVETPLLLTPSELQGAITQSVDAYFTKAEKSARIDKTHNKPPMWVYLLDHSYTEKGLHWRQLKGIDKTRAELLKEAAKTLELDVSLALADVQESWDCDDGSAYHGRYYYDDMGEEDGEDAELIELICSETTLRHWVDSDNNPLNYADYSVYGAELCWTKSTDEFEPFDSEYEGYMGNYGNTMDRWYHRAALVLWRKQDRYSVLFNIDPSALILELQRLIAQKAAKNEIKKIVTFLLPHWTSGNRNCFDLSQERCVKSIPAIFDLVIFIDDASLAKKLLSVFDVRLLSVKTVPFFLDLKKVYGEAWCLSLLESWKKKGTRQCENFLLLTDKLLDHPTLGLGLIDYQYHVIKLENKRESQNRSLVELIKDQAKRIGDVLDLLKACWMLSNNALAKAIIDYIAHQTTLYPPVALAEHSCSSVFKGVERRENWQPLYDYLIETLSAKQNEGLRKTDDWSIFGELMCNCEDCGVLGKFLRSKTSVNYVWPLATARRAHIHQKIGGLGIPVTHETERKGSPYKLHLTKTNKLHQQAKKDFKRLEAALENLQGFNNDK